MALPHQIATLLYVFNEQDEVLLLERARPPNQGLWSPGGGKLRTVDGESPYACACREAREELGWPLRPEALHLTGLISEHGYEGTGHWLMFLFEIKPKLSALPAPHREGRFEFVARRDLPHRPLPETDRTMIWPLFWRHRGGFFAAHCHCRADGGFDWIEEESVLPGRPS